MNANDITFGIELETTLPASDACRVGGHRAGRQVPWLPAGWLADGDPSIRVGPNQKPCEFISPILKGPEGVAQLVQAVATINAHGARVNDSCGVHIHIGFRGDEAALTRLVNLVANFEKAIFASTGTHRREECRWCNSIQRHGNAQEARRQASWQRYHILNLENVSRGHVEFRAFTASTNIVKILGWVRFCVGLVEKAQNGKKSSKFIAKPTVETSPIHRAGEGYTQLTRAFYALGWTRGRSDYVYGDLKADGAPDLLTCKKELVRLAKKYDGLDTRPDAESAPAPIGAPPVRRRRPRRNGNRENSPFGVAPQFNAPPFGH